MRPRRMRLLACLTLAVSLGSAEAQDDNPALVAPTGPRTPEAERAGFHLPPGFEIQLVASDPDIHKPMNIAFDDRGRLWVTETIEYPFPAGPGKKPRDTVKILEDFGPDGKARKITTFVDGVNIPIGLLPMPGGNAALVHSIPTIDRFTDTDGDGKADKREVAYKTFGSRDTHGMTNAFTWGFDGWIYACHGFSNSSEIAGRDGKGIKLVSGNSYRMKADGSHAEQFTHGQVNPFGLCFDTMGNLFSADCHSKPIYHLLRNGWYPSFGTVNDGLGLAPEMVTHDHGSTAISGLVIYEADQFPKEYRGTAFIGNVVTNRINHDKIEWKGSTPKGILQPDFLSSDDPWFRPVDIKLGPDGALYVADFYNKIIGHYEVPLTHPGRDRERGRIWRIVYRDPATKGELPMPPDFTKMSIGALMREIGDDGEPRSEFRPDNLARRTFAANQLVARGGKDVINAIKERLTSNPDIPLIPAQLMIHSLWVLERVDALDDDILEKALRNTRPDVRLHATTLLGNRIKLTDDQENWLRGRLQHDTPAVPRAAADSLAKHPGAANVRPLLDVRHAAPAEDEALVYVLRQALRDQFGAAVAWPKLDDKAYSEADYRTLADVALGSQSKDSATFVAAYLKRFPDGNGSLMALVHHVARFGDNETDGQLLTFAKGHRPDDLNLRAEMVKALFRGIQERGAPFVGGSLDFATETAKALLASPDDSLVRKGIELAEALHLASTRDTLLALMATATRPEPTRSAAISAYAAIDPGDAAEPLSKILLDEAAPAGLRTTAAGAMAKTNQASSRAKLLEILPIAPEKLQVTIAAALGTSRPGAEALLEAVEKGKASARLLQERAVRIWLDGQGVPNLANRIAKLTEGLPPADAKVAQLLQSRHNGLRNAKPDLKRGADVFTKNCATCHQIANQGVRIGPQLDGIGIRGADRLFEDILDPNRNIDQAFRLTTLALKDGRVVSGLMLREEGDVLVMADSLGKEQRYTKGEIEDRKVSPVSPMPADFTEKLPEADFYDLIEFLVSKKP